MKKTSPKAKTPAAELSALQALPDSAIDTTEIAATLDWSGGHRGAFYRPVKQQLTLRLDADVVAWFKAQAEAGAGYQTRINKALREHVRRHDESGR